ncbi:unnamed protein product [Rhizoctonia solani]|uniref:Uncharacterized protein n=1 Tax=Rhizoctonia solani TaxID=456999 RepID=A0A8H3CSH7_9AGAM|nr:unnamed protein product [Rhizoctonia solani]CAE7069025.1 unnamed protein product [Rhizoctonia solani]
MFWSRFLLVVLATVSVIAQSLPEKRGMVKASAKLGSREAPPPPPSPYDEIMAKIADYQNKTSKAMTEPKPERPAKLIAITTDLLGAIKDYNSGFQVEFKQLNPSDAAQRGQPMIDFSKKLYILLRSCKGTRDEKLYKNIKEISDLVDSIGGLMAEKIQPPINHMILPAYAKYSDKLNELEKATRAHNDAQ